MIERPENVRRVIIFLFCDRTESSEQIEIRNKIF